MKILPTPDETGVAYEQDRAAVLRLFSEFLIGGLRIQHDSKKGHFILADI